MPAFDKMKLEELVCKEGFDCECGKHHLCALEYLKIEKGAIKYLTEMLKTLGSSYPMVVCDENTYKAAGEKVCSILDAEGIKYLLHIIKNNNPTRIAPAEWEVGSTLMALDPKCDLVLGVGSGVINDTCKVVSFACGKKCAIVGTAPSMDGFASNSASMEVDHVKVSLYNHAPVGILLDPEIMAKAPLRMLQAGFGDMMAKFCSVCEWRISHLIYGDEYCENIAQIMRTAMKKILEASDGIVKRDEDAVQKIAEGLMLAGIAMSYAEISRPASGLEHYFSHMWEMQALERGKGYDLHGIQVGIGTVLTLKILNKLRTETPNREKAEAHMKAFDEKKWADDVNRLFGKTAPEIFSIENKAHKNDPAAHAKRLDLIIENWDKICQIIDEELPDYEELYAKMQATGMPMHPSDIDISIQDTVDAFLGSRDVRAKYLTSTLIWDLGLTEEYAQFVKEVAEKH